MRINPTSGFDAHGPAGQGKAQAEAGAKATVAPRPGDKASISLPDNKYVGQAMVAPEINTAAVAEARALLAGGRLDTPEAAQRVAGTLLEMGV